MFVCVRTVFSNLSSRHLADACNELGQALAGRLEDVSVTVPPVTVPPVPMPPVSASAALSSSSSPATVPRLDTTRLDSTLDHFQRILLDSSTLAEMYYTSAIGLFQCIAMSSAGNEVRNVIAAECNRSSLKRLLAIRMSEMISDTWSPLLLPSSGGKSAEGGEGRGKLAQLQALSVLTRALLGKKGNYFSFSLSITPFSASSKKKKPHQLKNSCMLYGKNDTALFMYRHEPLDFVHDGLRICELMHNTMEGLLGHRGAEGGVGGQQDPSRKMVANEMARHYFLKGQHERQDSLLVDVMMFSCSYMWMICILSSSPLFFCLSSPN